MCIVRQELCAISHAMVHSSEILHSFDMDRYKNLMMLQQSFMNQLARKDDDLSPTNHEKMMRSIGRLCLCYMTQ